MGNQSRKRTAMRKFRKIKPPKHTTHTFRFVGLELSSILKEKKIKDIVLSNNILGYRIFNIRPGCIHVECLKCDNIDLRTITLGKKAEIEHTEYPMLVIHKYIHISIKEDRQELKSQK